MGSITKLLAARDLLKINLEKSKTLSSALDKTDSKLKKIKQNLPSSEAAFRTQSFAFSKLADHIQHAVSPMLAVLRVFISVSELEKSLVANHCRSDLCSYLSTVTWLEQALKLLSNSSCLAVKWLEYVIEFLKDNDTLPGCNKYLLNIETCIRVLQHLQAAERTSFVLASALDNIEFEFGRILDDGSIPSFSTSCLHKTCIIIPATSLQKLQAVIVRLKANSRTTNCASIYVNSRVSSTRTTLEALGVDYLHKSITEFDDIEDLDDQINQWVKHLKLAVKEIFELEHRICKQVFEEAGSGTWLNCFAEIADESKFILLLLKFGTSITECKKTPAKLLKLLDIFSVLHDLRLDFNRLFGGEGCSEIRALTRDLIKGVVDGAGDVFWELSYHVELQRQSSPPSDGSVPKLVGFVTNFCNQLLNNKYKPILEEILKIRQSWKHEDYHEEILVVNIYSILKEIAMNLDSWSKSYVDISLAYLFMMNNHCHFSDLKGTELGNMMGDSWLKAHEQYKEYYATLFIRKSWAKLPPVLNQTIHTKYAPNSIKRILKAFNDGFDDLYKKQSNWVISNEAFRQKTQHVLVQVLVPFYSRYMQQYGVALGEEETKTNVGKYIKYSEKSLENKLRTLFQPLLIKNGSTKHSHADAVGEIKSVMTKHLQVALKAT